MRAAAPGFGPLQFLYRVDGVITEIVAYGLSPDGLRVDSRLEGKCAGEVPFAGADVRGVSYLTFRLDGVANFEFRSDIRSPAGEHVAAHAIGYAIPPGDFALPSPDEVMESDYRWPDVQFRVHAFITYRTGLSLAWLNRTVVAAEGAVNPGTRKFSHVMGVLRPPQA